MPNLHIETASGWRRWAAWIVVAALTLGGCSCGGGGGDADGGVGDGGGTDGMVGDAMMMGPDGMAGDSMTGPDGMAGDGMAGDGMAGDGMAGDGMAGDGMVGDGGLPDGMMDAGPPPAMCSASDPTVVSNQVTTTLTLVGSNIHTGATVLLRDVDSGTDIDLGPATVADDGASATVEVSSVDVGGPEQGFYAVVLVDPVDGELVCGDLQVTALPPPTVTEVVPDTAWNGAPGDGVLSDRTVTVRGTGFQNTPAVVFVNRADPSKRYNALFVNFVSSTELSAVVPSETLSMPEGEYDVFVVNPDGLSGQWIDPDTGMPGTFFITGTPPPTILNVDPFRGAAAEEVTLTIEGLDFQSGAVVSLIMPDGTVLDLATTFVDANTLTAVIPADAVGIDVYPVQVTNPDGQFDVWHAYSATSSATAKLDAFETTAADLVVARWRHDTMFGFDPFSRAYLYVTGGLDTDGNVLESTEILEISGLSVPAQPRLSMQWESSAAPRVVNALETPRESLALVRAGRFLYAIGGASTNTHVETPADSQLDSVERAKILDFTEMPQIQLPQSLGGSGLPIGTWYYQVSALGSWGESLPSREVQVLREGGRIQVCWANVDGASGYNLYRSVASDGRAGTGRLLITEIAPDAGARTCITDTGRDDFQPAPGRLRGQPAAPAAGGGLAEGVWGYRVTATVDGRETIAGYRAFIELTSTDLMDGNSAIELRWDPVPDATYSVYRTDGALTGTPEGDEETYLIASGLTDRTLLDDGLTVDTDMPAPDGIRALEPGSISTWATLTTTLTVPREGLDGLVLTVPSGAAEVDDRTLVYVTGGRSTSTASQTYLTTTEFAEVDTVTGDLGPFQVSVDTMGSDVELETPRAFYALLTNVGQREARRPPPPEEPPCTDFDGDGYLPVSCEPDCASGGGDCDDTDPNIHCMAEEVCGDGIDQNCDGMDMACPDDCPVDADGDGYDVPACGGCDCDDTDATIHCEAADMCEDGIDQDCDGTDPMCPDECPIDNDMDGETVPECNGCDCDDNNPDVRCGIVENCDDTPDLCDDGVDNNCDGSDCTCIILFSRDTPEEDSRFEPIRWTPPFPASGYSWYDQLRDHVASPYQVPYFGDGYTRSVADGPIVLIAVAGDDQYVEISGQGNVGLTTFEVTEISTANDATNGELLGWTLQQAELNPGRRTLGLDALLYFDVMWPFPAVTTEFRTTGAVTPQSSAGARYPFDEAAGGDAYLDRFESTSAAFSIPRAYYTTTRVNGGVFAVGGRDETGPISVIERTVP